jgi:hypothetical protein
VNSVNGEPVKRALITLLQFGKAEVDVPRAPLSRQVMADAAGAFQFTGLPAGTYSIGAAKPQFRMPLELPASSIVLGPSRDNVELKLEPFATLQGVVLDADGLPIRGVSIKALQSLIDGGRREFQESRSVSTDDRGHYRLWNLGPGAYYIRVAGRSGGTRQYLGENAPRVDWPEAVAPVYYGGATTVSSARPVTLNAGQQLSADFTVPLLPAFKIRGSIANFVAHEKIAVELRSRDGQTVKCRVSVNGASGEFVVNDVTAGDYKLRATQGAGEEQTRAEVDVNASNGDLNGVDLRLTRGVNIPVSFHCDAGDNATSEPQLPCSAMVTLAPLAEAEREPRNFWGHGPFKNVFPGEYRLQAKAFGRSIAAATLGGVDISGKLTLQPGVDPGPVEIWMRSDGGAIEGTVDVEKRPPTMQVLLVPEFASISGAFMVGVDESGQFKADQLAPGDYTAYAFSDLSDVEYAEPEARRSFENGVKVHVTAKGEEQIKITGLAR